MTAIVYGCSGQAGNLAASPEPLASPQPAAAHPRVVVASWYGPGFVGHPTSNGETYNDRALTAASTSLPMGSHVRVTNLANRRSVVVRINDRGPYVKGRGIDLSRRAAEKIGLARKGVGAVQVKRLDGPTGEIGNSWPGTVDVGRADERRTRRYRRRRVTHYASATGSRARAATSEATMLSNPVGSWLLEMVSPGRPH